MYQVKRMNKYGAKSQEHGGVRYHSKLEASHAMELDLLVKAKEIKGYDRQVRIEFNLKKKGEDWVLTTENRMDLKAKGIPFIKYEDYIIDFLVYHNDDSQEWIEVKGKESTTWRRKWRLLEATHGETDQLTVLKAKNIRKFY